MAGVAARPRPSRKPAVAAATIGAASGSVGELESRIAALTAELQEARDQQTATAEVLGVINSSPGDLPPVFDAMLEKAMHLCGAAFGELLINDGGDARLAAAHGVPKAFASFRQHSPARHSPTSIAARIFGGQSVVHTLDAKDEDLYRQDDPQRIALVDLGGARTTLAVGLVRDKEVLGLIHICRREVRPFTDKQISLLQNFAAQAVIAMENARLITETREALEQQTATAEVLGVINSSPGDLAPVFDAMLEKATRLCGAAFAILWRFDGEFAKPEASYRVPAAWAEFWKDSKRPPAGSGPGLVMGGGGTQAVADMTQHAPYLAGEPMARAIVELAGARSLMITPLRKEDMTLGAITIYRQEVLPFSDKEIALLENFAAQAVVAMENARLLNETRQRTAELQEALEYQTATSDVLKVISRSTFNLQPVLQTLVEAAVRLCEADFGHLDLPRGGEFRPVATLAFSPEFDAILQRTAFVPSPGTTVGRVLLTKGTVHLADVTHDPDYAFNEAVSLGNVHAVLGVPLLRGEEIVGVFALGRERAEGFTERQIELVQTFADQAGIAIQNTRLITETREALEQQTATAEVLGVINSSPGDLAPVFDAMLDKAMHLCEAAFGQLATFNGERFQTAATRGVPAAFAEYRRNNPPNYGPGTTPARILHGEHVIRTDDLKSEPAYDSAEPNRRALVDLGGARSALIVALRKEGKILGFIEIYRQEVRPFSEQQMALLENFAAQAVIAMENARLITETREALEKQTATAEVLRVISASPTDLQPTFDAIAARATTLCGAASGAVYRFDGSLIHFAAHYGWEQEELEATRSAFPMPPGEGSITARAIMGRKVANSADVSSDSSVQPILAQAFRTVLSMPMLRDGNALGAITVTRRRVEPFTEAQIELLKTFADQAVIATENVRLFTELGDALEQQTATSEVLQVINSSPGNLAPVFDAMLEKAMRLCEAAFGFFTIYDGNSFRAVAQRGVPSALTDYFTAGMDQPKPGDAHARLLAGENVIHHLDQKDEEAYRAGNPLRRAVVDLGGARSALVVALRKDGRLLGAFTIYRKDVRPFSEKQIALLQNFAAQAVIAMENARLITETREALEQQTATAEVLQVINSSPGELAPVFDAMLEKALHLCDAALGILGTYDGAAFRWSAGRGVPASMEEYMRQPVNPVPGMALHRIAQGETVVHIADITADPAYRSANPNRRLFVDLAGVRTTVWVGLRKDDALLGVIAIYRQEVRPFTEQQISVLQNFAAQAVIAMENARLITETREALEQQTATAEVLGVINSSPGDLAPVFDAMLERALSLCEGGFGQLATFDGIVFRAAAWRGYGPSTGEGTKPIAGMALHQLVEGTDVVHVPDITADEVYRSGNAVRRRLADQYGARTAIWIALKKDTALLGAFVIYRKEVRPFTDKEIALLQNFAAQAVIAMENARLITETREALEQQTATAEVLQVINSSPGDLVPVFDAILEKAHRLCGIAFGSLQLYESGKVRAVAVRAVAEDLAELLRQPMAPQPGSATSRLLSGERFVQNADIAEAAKRFPDDPRMQLSAARGLRTGLFVPLRKEADFLGYISAFRDQIRPFSDKEIALLENFAAQAVIAMENVRLITETREALEQQTATAEVLGVINSSPGDLAPVFDSMLEKALHLCEANFGNMFLYDGGKDRSVAVRGAPEFARWMAERGAVQPAPGSIGDRLMHGEDVVHIIDAATEAAYESSATRRAVVEIGGFHTLLAVTLQRGDAPVGGIVVYRKEVRPFSNKQIALLQNFAAQAVIAMENARLLTETREARDEAESALRDLKAAQANLIQSEKMASLGQLTAGIAHEIKNPLNFVNNFAGLSVELLDELKAAPAIAAIDDGSRSDIDETIEMLTGNLEKIAEHGKRADGIVRSMLEHSRGVTGERREVDVNALVDEALNLAYHGARAQDQSFNITLERDFAAGIGPVTLVPQDMMRVFLNLIGNGFHAAHQRRKDGADTGFRPVLRLTTRDVDDTVEVRVRDNGTGIRPEHRDKLFQPFFTTKPTGEGTGLGLSISYDIVTQEHGGTITVDSTVDDFTEFTIRLPRQARLEATGRTV